MRHATDPDHVVAITTIVSRERTIFHASVIGAIWGLGHTSTILVVGSAIILLKVSIPPTLGLTMEMSVGCMLMFLGTLSLTGLMQRVVDRLTGGEAHSHFILGRLIVHTHSSDSSFTAAGRKLGFFHVLRPLVVGIVHGLAGSAAVALFVLATIQQPRWAVSYLLVFGIGTIVGMMLITAMIALPFTYTMRHFARLNQFLAVGSGALSLLFGLFLCYQVGISDGLLMGHPIWTPR